MTRKSAVTAVTRVAARAADGDVGGAGAFMVEMAAARAVVLVNWRCDDQAAAAVAAAIAAGPLGAGV